MEEIITFVVDTDGVEPREVRYSRHVENGIAYCVNRSVLLTPEHRFMVVLDNPTQRRVYFAPCIEEPAGRCATSHLPDHYGPLADLETALKKEGFQHIL